ncbi:MAG: alanine--glyoxylate aminotransferase family protein [Thaumarchaeota archaeon]|jgi:aspartate aminotransferase-like enzyme|nr:alanine--glyoxylate aminotransferase family protein [Candidatus Geocrenenecus arthurdayi]
MKKILMTPGPVELHPRVRKAISRQVVSHRSTEFHQLIESIIENARKIFKTSGDIFILTSSGTLAVECALANLLELGDTVFIPVYGVFGKRMSEAAEQYGGRVVNISLDWNKALSIDELEDTLTHNNNVEIVSFVHNETSTGTMVKELSRISEIVKKYGKLLVVDAVSSLGGVPIPVEKLGIDVCITGAQKCLAGPPGISLISVSDEAWKKILSKSSRTPSYIDLKKYRQFMGKLETPFTPAVNLMYGLDEALKIIIEKGVENWWRNHYECSQLLYNQLESSGLTIHSLKEYRSITVAAAYPPQGINPKTLVEEMEQRGVTIAEGMDKLKDKIIRIACMGNINKKKIKYVMSKLRECVETLKSDNTKL